MSRETLPRRRGAETRRRLLDAARELIATRGWGQTTVDDIVLAADVSKGGFYHHFAGKEQLFRALLGRRDPADLQQLARACSDAATIHQVLVQLVRSWLAHFADTQQVLLSLEFRLQALRDDWFRAQVTAHLAGLQDMLAGLVRAAQADGVVPATVDPNTAATLMFALLDGATLHHAHIPASTPPTSRESALVTAVEAILQVRDPAAATITGVKQYLLHCAHDHPPPDA